MHVYAYQIPIETASKISWGANVLECVHADDINDWAHNAVSMKSFWNFHFDSKQFQWFRNKIKSIFTVLDPRQHVQEVARANLHYIRSDCLRMWVNQRWLHRRHVLSTVPNLHVSHFEWHELCWFLPIPIRPQLWANEEKIENEMKMSQVRQKRHYTQHLHSLLFSKECRICYASIGM